MITILIFIIILSVLVLIHEAGHFFVAKKFGIKVEEFGIGFPPRVFGKKIGETLYSLNLLPIGGFVKLYGEDDAGSGKIKVSKREEKDLERAFFARPVLQRALVVVAGVLMNFLLAYAIMVYLFTFKGVPSLSDEVTVSQITQNSPAEKAGIKANDRILTLNGNKISSTEQLVSETRKFLGEKITLELKRGNDVKKIEVTPRKDFPKDQGPMGVAISQEFSLNKYPFPRSLYEAGVQVAQDSIRIVVAFKDVVVNLATRFTIPQGVAGPIGVAQLTGEFVKVGGTAVLSLVYMLSLSLAVLNILPIPALDGGRFFFILIEAITRKKINPKFEAYAHAAGIVLLLTFLAVVSYKDIIRILSGQSLLPQ